MLLVYNPDSRELQAWGSTDIINRNIPTVRCYNWFILLLLGDSATLHEVRTLFEKEPVDDCQCQKCGRECKELFRLGMKDWTASSNFDSPVTRVALAPIDAGGCRKILRFSLPKKRVGKKEHECFAFFVLCWNTWITDICNLAQHSFNWPSMYLIEHSQCFHSGIFTLPITYWHLLSSMASLQNANIHSNYLTTGYMYKLNNNVFPWTSLIQ